MIGVHTQRVPTMVFHVYFSIGNSFEEAMDPELLTLMLEHGVGANNAECTIVDELSVPPPLEYGSGLGLGFRPQPYPAIVRRDTLDAGLEVVGEVQVIPFWFDLWGFLMN